MPWRRLVLTALIIGPILGLLAFGFTRDARYITSPLLAKPATPFTVTLFDGRKVTLDELRGKAVFLNFWASWCPPCLVSMPLLDGIGATARIRAIDPTARVVVVTDFADAALRDAAMRAGALAFVSKEDLSQLLAIVR